MSRKRNNAPQQKRSPPVARTTTDSAPLDLESLMPGDPLAVAIEGTPASTASLIATASPETAESAALAAAGAEQEPPASETAEPGADAETVEAGSPPSVAPEECSHDVILVDREAGSTTCQQCRSDLAGQFSWSMSDEARVPKHRRCPTCWSGYGGKAHRRKWHRRVSGTLEKRCYICDQCGCEWIVEVRSDVSDKGLVTETTRIAEVRLHDEDGAGAPGEVISTK